MSGISIDSVEHSSQAKSRGEFCNRGLLALVHSLTRLCSYVYEPHRGVTEKSFVTRMVCHDQRKMHHKIIKPFLMALAKLVQTWETGTEQKDICEQE